jgi:hypothetical protein
MVAWWTIVAAKSDSFHRKTMGDATEESKTLRQYKK